MTQQQVEQTINQLLDQIDEIGDWDLQRLQRKITDEVERREKGRVNSIKEMIQLASQRITTFYYYSSLPGKSTISDLALNNVLEQIREKGELFELDGEIWEIKSEVEYFEKQFWLEKAMVSKAKFYVSKRSAVQKLL